MGLRRTPQAEESEKVQEFYSPLATGLKTDPPQIPSDGNNVQTENDMNPYGSNVIALPPKKDST